METICNAVKDGRYTGQFACKPLRVLDSRQPESWRSAKTPMCFGLPAGEAFLQFPPITTVARQGVHFMSLQERFNCRELADGLQMVTFECPPARASILPIFRRNLARVLGF